MFSENTADLKSITNLTVGGDVAISANLYVFLSFLQQDWMSSKRNDTLKLENMGHYCFPD